MQKKNEIDETSARKELTDDMLVAGVMAYHEWEDRKRTDSTLSVHDLVSSLWVAFRRAGGYPHA